jgi:hypothetical protein
VLASWRSFFPRALAIFSVLLATIWFVKAQESRYLIPVYVTSAIFPVIGWKYVAAEGSRLARLLSCTIVAVSIFYGAFMIGKVRSADVHAVFSPSFAEERRQREIPYLDSFKYLNSEPSVQRVLIVNSMVPSYYSDKEYVKPFGQYGERTLPGVEDAAAALKQVQSLNVTHVLDVESDTKPFQLAPGSPGFTLVFESRGQRVYRVE